MATLPVYTNSEVKLLVPLERIIMLKADVAYTHIYFLHDNKVQKELQSYNLGRYASLEKHQFIRARHSHLINVNYISGIGKNRKLHLRLPKGYTLEIPKARWPQIKQQLNRQMVIPFWKMGDSSDQMSDT